MLVTTIRCHSTDEHAAEHVAEQHHSDAERDRHDAAAEGNDGQRGQQDGEDEEALVEAGDVDRQGTRHPLTCRDHELSPDRSPHHRAHLGQIQVGDFFAQRVQPSDQGDDPVAVHQQRYEHVQEDDRRRDRADDASRGSLQELQQPLTDVLRGRRIRFCSRS